jgi:hypothetical protein
LLKYDCATTPAEGKREFALELALPDVQRDRDGGHSKSDRTGFSVEGIEHHVKNTLLAHFEFVQDSQAGTHRAYIMQKISISSREYNDPVFIHPAVNCKFEKFESIH